MVLHHKFLLVIALFIIATSCVEKNNKQQNISPEKTNTPSTEHKKNNKPRVLKPTKKPSEKETEPRTKQRDTLKPIAVIP